MNDLYIEERIKQKIKGTTMLKIVGLILSALVAMYLAMVFYILFMVAIPYVAFAIYLITRCNYEYEYLYFQGELDIDRISAKSSRKRILSVNVKEMEILAPTGSAELQRYNNLKSIDCSSNTGKKTYEMVATRKGQLVRIIFEPSQKLVDGMRMLAPRKVFYN